MSKNKYVSGFERWMHKLTWQVTKEFEDWDAEFRRVYMRTYDED